MVKTQQGWMLLSPLELLAVEAVGGAPSANEGGGIGSGVDGVRHPGSGVPGGGGCDIICGCSDSGHMANGGGHIVGKVLVKVGVLGGGGSLFCVVGT
eukprot:g15888.t1